MNRNLRVTMAFLATTAVIGTIAVSCSANNDFDGEVPAGYPIINGVTNCGWVDSPEECKNSGIDSQHWVQMQDTEPQDHSATNFALMMALYNWRVHYWDYYSSPAYYNNYVPADRRANYTTVINNFNSNNQSQLKAASGSKSVPGVSDVKPAPQPFTRSNNGGDRNAKVNCGMAFPEIVVLTLPEKSGGGGASGSGTSGGSGSRGTGSGTSGGSNSTTGGSNGTTGGNGAKPGTGDRGNGGKSRVGC